MKFENVSRLTAQLQDQLRHIDFLWTTDIERFSSQNGVVRTNCMDCLDRTNVVQSAIARQMLLCVRAAVDCRAVQRHRSALIRTTKRC